MPGDDVIETVAVRVRPDLTGFRRELKAKLEAATTGVAAQVRLGAARGDAVKDAEFLKRLRDKHFADSLAKQRAGEIALQGLRTGHVKAARKQREVDAAAEFGRRKRDAQYLTKLEVKSIHEQFKRARNPFEQVERDREAAADKNLARDLSNLGTRFKRQLAGEKATRDAIEQTAKVERDADDQFFVNLGRRFDQQRKGAAASKKAAAEQATADKRAATEAQSAAVSRQRADEQYANFHRQIADELGKIDDAREHDAVAHAAEREREVARIDRAGLTSRVKMLQAAQNVENDAIRQTEQVEKASLRRRAAQRSSVAKATKMPTVIDTGGRGIKPINLLRGAAVALSPALIAVGSSAIQASTALAALGASGIGAGLALGGLVVGFSHLGDVLALHQQVRKEGVKTVANAAAAESKAAKKSATDQYAEIDRQDRIKDAIEAVQDARRSVVLAQREDADAQRDVHKARKEAIQDLKDLRQELRNLANDERSDALSVQEAREKQAQTSNNYWATELEKRRAAQDVADAENKLADTHNEKLKKRRELADAERKGVERADKVVEARQSAADARERLANAKRGVTRERRDLSRARRPLADSTVAAAGLAATSSAAAQLQDELNKMGPGLRGLYTWVIKNEDGLKRLRTGIENAVLPGFTHFLEQVSIKSKASKSSLEVFADAAGELGGIVGDTVGKFGEMTNEPWFRERFATIQKNNAASFKQLGQAALTLVKPLMQIFAAASPLTTTFSGGLLKLTQRFAAFIDKAEKSGALKQWFADAREEFGKWLHVGRNVVAVLGAIFKGSLPAGQGLMDRFVAFTDKMAEWATSDKGTKGIKDFFAVFKDLPYGNIRDLFAQTVVFLTAVRLFKFATGSPFGALITMLGVLAAKDPKNATEVMKKVTDFILDGLGWIDEHPKSAATLLAIFAAMKAAKAVSVGLTLPGVSSLVSKFKPLEKALGGLTRTATMTVHAGVVNILGGLDSKGNPVVAGGGKDGKGAPAKGGKKTPRLRGGRGGTLAATVVALAVDPVLDATMGDPKKGSTKGAVKSAVSGAATGAALGSFFGPPGTVAGGVLGGLYGYGTEKGFAADDQTGKNFLARFNASLPSVKAEAEAFLELNRYLGDNSAAIDQNSQASADSNRVLGQYIAARRTSVTETANSVRMTQGETAAQLYLEQQNVRSRQTLEDMLLRLGWNAKAAHDYALKIYGIPRARSTQITTPGTPEAKAELKFINGQLATLSKDHKAHVSVTGYKDVTTQLVDLMGMQEALRLGLTWEEGRENVKRQAMNADRQSPVRKAKARGGRVWGAGTSTSDSIEAWLSNGEYVQPTDVVQHYGQKAMDDLRQKRVPKASLATGYAGGGPVVMPFPVNVSKTQIPQPLVDMGGTAVGDIDVARIAENTARAMQATNKQLVALIEAGIVESGLRNLSYGDRDSVGFLQQRASWGSRAERMNVAVATAKFIRKAKRMDHRGQSSGQLAQAVQVSAFPDRYDRREADAYAVINRELPGIAGGLPGAFTGKVPKGLGRVSGINKQMLAAAVAIHSQFPGVTVTSGYRPGSITVTGNRSYHGQRRAIDLAPPSMPLFESVRSRYGPVAQEIIYSPANGRQIWHGRNHMYSGAVRRIHYDHVHLALSRGGPVRAFDTGGKLPPGMHTVYNGTGHDETVRTRDQERALTGGSVRLDKRDIVLLAQHIAAASAQPVHMDGRKVAEIVRGYDYLPAGV